jgi:hypothetical protein
MAHHLRNLCRTDPDGADLDLLPGQARALVGLGKGAKVFAGTVRNRLHLPEVLPKDIQIQDQTGVSRSDLYRTEVFI